MTPQIIQQKFDLWRGVGQGGPPGHRTISRLTRTRLRKLSETLLTVSHVRRGNEH